MNISCENNNGETVIRIEGELTIYNVIELKMQLLSRLEKPGDIELDLAKVSEIDSSAVQVFILAKREAAQRSCTLRLVNHSPAVVDIFELYNLGSYFGDPVLMSMGPTQEQYTRI